MSTAAIHPLGSTTQRASVPEAGTTEVRVKTTTTVPDDDLLKKPQVQQQQQTRWTSATQGVMTNLKQVYDQAKTLPETVRAQDWSGNARQVYDTTRNKINEARDSEQLNRLTTTVKSNWQLLRDRIWNMMAKENDPHHSKEMMTVSSEAWNETKTIPGMFMFLLLATMHFWLMLPDQILHFLGLRSNKIPGKFTLRQVNTSPAIWVGEYVMPVGSSNTIIIQGQDGTLLLRSPPEPTPPILAEISKLGTPSVLLLTLAHDTYGDRWKEMYPNARVLAMSKDASAISNRVKVDTILDQEGNSDLLQNFRIERVIPTAQWSRLEDPVLILDLGQNRRGAMFGCGFSNCSEGVELLNPLKWRDWLLGRSGFGLMRSYAYFVGKNDQSGQAQEMWREITQIPGLDTLLFLHGDPIVQDNNLKRLMDTVNISKLRMFQ